MKFVFVFVERPLKITDKSNIMITYYASIEFNI